jgi:hypothetical protein
MFEIRYSELKQIMTKLFKYKWWGGTYDLNVVGIRCPNRTADSFDDTIVAAYVDAHGNNRLTSFPITTDPGLNYLTKPINAKGCAILAPGQYLGMWRLGKHQGKYPALVQVKPCKVFRDINRDSKLDFEPHTLETGLFGINLHYVTANTIVQSIGNGSAGCQVHPVKEDNDYILSLVNLQMRYIKTDAVSYTLLLESELK